MRRSRTGSGFLAPVLCFAAAAARAAGLATLDLPSGAGHDAQNVARFAPIGMIFVPSRGGISHSLREFTSWEDVANGAEVLYRSVLLLDQRLNREWEGREQRRESDGNFAGRAGIALSEVIDFRRLLRLFLAFLFFLLFFLVLGHFFFAHLVVLARGEHRSLAEVAALSPGFPLSAAAALAFLADAPDGRRDGLRLEQ